MPSLSPERIGKFEMRVTCCAPTVPSAADRRVEALTAWLLAQWQARQQEGEHVKRDERSHGALLQRRT
ncbi:MAG: hypothetical protein K6T59_00725 [Bryobacteraceae bacterium]|nr:hypothetical protein [Bryobacteraceae bacterium]